MKRNLAVLLTLFMVISLCACGASTSDSQVDNSEQNSDTGLSISDTLSSEHFDFSIISVSVSSSVKSEVGTVYEAADGNQIVTIIFSAKNTSDDTQNVMSPNFNSYVDGTKVTTIGAAGKVEGYMPLIGAVSAGKTFEGYALWELPENWNELEFSYIDALTGSESDNSLVIHSTDISS